MLESLTAHPHLLLTHRIGTASSKHARRLLAIQKTQCVEMLAVRRYQTASGKHVSSHSQNSRGAPWARGMHACVWALLQPLLGVAWRTSVSSTQFNVASQKL